MTREQRNRGGQLRKGTRLWPVFKFLLDRGRKGATGLELTEHVEGTINISTTVADLRKILPTPDWQYRMAPATYKGRSSTGAKVYHYHLEPVGGPAHDTHGAARHDTLSTPGPADTPARCTSRESHTAATTDKHGQVKLWPDHHRPV